MKVQNQLRDAFKEDKGYRVKIYVKKDIKWLVIDVLSLKER